MTALSLSWERNVCQRSARNDVMYVYVSVEDNRNDV
jgi:hypothetical protein